MVFSFGLRAQQDTTSYVLVSDVVIHGNNVTKDAIIFRELTFGIGDTVPSWQWEEELRVSRENVMNTTLFNFVTFEQHKDKSNKNGIILVIDVVERWYL